MILAASSVFLSAQNLLAAGREPGLEAGVLAPDFEATSVQGNTIKLSELYAKGPVVLVFYRGSWCKFCDVQLQSYKFKEADFEALGVPVIFISVDNPYYAARTVKDKEFPFDVISDPSARLLKSYNVVNRVTDDKVEEYKSYGIDLEEASGENHHIIAVPATYVINKKGKIYFSYVNTDYKIRVSINTVLGILKELNSGGHPKNPS